MALDFTKDTKGVFLVNVLGIVYNKKLKKIAIGKRQDDPLVPNLTWSFPGGRPVYDKPIEESLKDEIKKKLGLKNVKIKQLILARIPKENEQFLLLYYYCETEETKLIAGEKFLEAEWISPKEYKKYFKTSVHLEIKKILKNI